MVHKLWHASDFIPIFLKGHNSRKGDTSDKKKTCVSYFSMRNPYMKFKTLACTVLKIWHASNQRNNWSCIAHLSAEDVLKSAVIEKEKFKNIKS